MTALVSILRLQNSVVALYSVNLLYSYIIYLSNQNKATYKMYNLGDGFIFYLKVFLSGINKLIVSGFWRLKEGQFKKPHLTFVMFFTFQKH